CWLSEIPLMLLGSPASAHCAMGAFSNARGAPPHSATPSRLPRWTPARLARAFALARAAGRSLSYRLGKGDGRRTRAPCQQPFMPERHVQTRPPEPRVLARHRLSARRFTVRNGIEDRTVVYVRGRQDLASLLSLGECEHEGIRRGERQSE